MVSYQKYADGIQFICWTMAYMLMAWNAYRFRRERNFYMPLLPGALCLSWEICSVFDSVNLGRIVWICLDAVIFYFNTLVIERLSRRCMYVISTIAMCFGLVMAVAKANTNLLLQSAFVIDVIIGFFYIVDVKNIANYDVYRIAILRTIGDTSAWIAYSRLSRFILIIGFVELLLNLLFFAVRIEIDSNGG